MKVNWGTAKVILKRGALRLRVQVEPDPDSHWKRAFDDIADRASTEIGRRSPSGARVDSVSSRVITVWGIQPGTESAIHDALDEIVAAANVEADFLKRESDESQSKNAARAEALARAAAEATEIFRRSGVRSGVR